MIKGLEKLAEKEYPGRFIILGRDISNQNNLIIYGLTGRSPSSQARYMEWDEEGKQVLVKPTEIDVVNMGYPDLLIYPSILLGNLKNNSTIAVSNGKHTISIKEEIGKHNNPTGILSSAMNKWEFEPDEPTYTPRISGIITQNKATLGIVRRDETGYVRREYFEVPLKSGTGHLITTYRGEDTNPVPTFEGTPLEILLREKDERDIAKTVYDSLEPKDPNKDFRISVSVVSYNLTKGNTKLYIINRNGGKK